MLAMMLWRTAYVRRPVPPHYSERRCINAIPNARTRPATFGSNAIRASRRLTTSSAVGRNPARSPQRRNNLRVGVGNSRACERQRRRQGRPMLRAHRSGLNERSRFVPRGEASISNQTLDGATAAALEIMRRRNQAERSRSATHSGASDV
jgi:hypothetical protein